MQLIGRLLPVPFARQKMILMNFPTNSLKFVSSCLLLQTTSLKSWAAHPIRWLVLTHRVVDALDTTSKFGGWHRRIASWNWTKVPPVGLDVIRLTRVHTPNLPSIWRLFRLTISSMNSTEAPSLSFDWLLVWFRSIFSSFSLQPNEKKEETRSGNSAAFFCHRPISFEFLCVRPRDLLFPGGTSFANGKFSNELDEHSPFFLQEKKTIRRNAIWLVTPT